MICALLSNLSFWSALFGLLGTILIFLYGLPIEISSDGDDLYFVSEKEDKIKYRKIAKYSGLLLIAASFLIELINIVVNLK